MLCYFLLVSFLLNSHAFVPASFVPRQLARSSRLLSTEVREVNGQISSETPSEEGISAEEEERRKVERERFTLFVGNLPFDASDEKVKELFEAHGKVELISVPKDRNTGQPRGFAFVDMSTADELEAAVTATDGSSFGGRVLRVSKSVPKDQIQQQPRPDIQQEPEGMKKLYVGNIPFSTSTAQIMGYYAQFGEVVEVYIPVDSKTGEGRGFAFVTMKDEDADKAIEATNGIDFEGRKLVVSVPLPPGEKSRKKAKRATASSPSLRKKLYVGNLSFYTVGETLAELFGEFGPVYDCYLPEDPSTGGSRGFGFITMGSEDAVRAIEELNGCEVDGRIIRVNEAQPKRGTSSDDEAESRSEMSMSD